jgi:hypothetical protein
VLAKRFLQLIQIIPLEKLIFLAESGVGCTNCTLRFN